MSGRIILEDEAEGFFLLEDGSGYLLQEIFEASFSVAGVALSASVGTLDVSALIESWVEIPNVTSTWTEIPNTSSVWVEIPNVTTTWT